MTAFWIVQGACVLVFVAFLITQVIYPALSGIPLFPILRSDHRKAENKLADVRDNIAVRRVEDEATMLENSMSTNLRKPKKQRS